MPRLMRNARMNRRGLTLTELMIAIVILAIVGGGVTRVMMKQQQFYKDARLTAGAKRELRLGATVLPAELRSISSSGGDILSMTESEMQMRAYTGSSIICARNNNTIWIPPTNLAHHTLSTFVQFPEVGDTIFLYNENILKGSEDDVWEKREITARGTSSTACPGAPYTDPVADAPAAKRRAWFTLDTDLPDSVKVGAVVRFTRPVKYYLYQGGSGSWYMGLSEYSGGWGTPAPLAGPFRPYGAGDNGNSGMQFRFYDSVGVRITDMTLRSRVARVDVFLRTNAGISALKERNGAALKDSVLMRVAIRNFK